MFWKEGGIVVNFFCYLKLFLKYVNFKIILVGLVICFVRFKFIVNYDMFYLLIF